MGRASCVCIFLTVDVFLSKNFPPDISQENWDKELTDCVLWEVGQTANKKGRMYAKPQGSASIYSFEVKSCSNGNNIISQMRGRINPSEGQLGVSCQRGASWD